MKKNIIFRQSTFSDNTFLRNQSCILFNSYNDSQSCREIVACVISRIPQEESCEHLFLQQCLILAFSLQAQQPGAVSCKVESISNEETVIEIKRDISNDNSMGNVLATADEILFSEVKSSTDVVKG